MTRAPNGLTQSYKFLNPDDFDLGEINRFQDIEMGIIGDNEFCIPAYRAVNEFVVVRVGDNQVVEEGRFNFPCLWRFENGRYYCFCYLWRCFPREYFLIFLKYVI